MRMPNGILQVMPSASGRTGEPLTVLYVEDDERLGRLTCQYLESHGLTVHLCRRGDQAMAEVTRLRPDVVLLDVMMPQVSGIEEAVGGP